jgi:hypothetical protein
MRLILVLAVFLGFWTDQARSNDQCPVPEGMLTPTVGLPNLAQRLKNGQAISIVIYGTASITGAGLGRSGLSFPTRFAEFIKKKYPNKEITVIVKSRLGETTAQMVDNLKFQVISEKPDLVIWQTGSVDVVKNIDINLFGDSLERGLDMLREANIDVILIDQQYNPHTAPLNNVEEYQDYMEGIAIGRGVLRFSRYDLMRYWVTSGRFPFNEEKQENRQRVATELHGCIGWLLSEMVSEALH